MVAMGFGVIIFMATQSKSCVAKRQKAAETKAIYQTAWIDGSPIYDYNRDWEIHKQRFAFDAFVEDFQNVREFNSGYPSWPKDPRPLPDVLQSYRSLSRTLDSAFTKITKEKQALTRDASVAADLISQAENSWLSKIPISTMKKIQSEVHDGIQERLAIGDRRRHDKWYPFGKSSMDYLKDRIFIYDYSLIVPKKTSGMGFPNPLVIVLAAIELAGQSKEAEGDLAPSFVRTEMITIRFSPAREAEILERIKKLGGFQPPGWSLAAFDVQLRDHSFKRLALITLNYKKQPAEPMIITDIHPDELVKSTEHWKFRN
jgi:hypothetical protein